MEWRIRTIILVIYNQWVLFNQSHRNSETKIMNHHEGYNTKIYKQTRNLLTHSHRDVERVFLSRSTTWTNDPKTRFSAQFNNMKDGLLTKWTSLIKTIIITR